MDMSPGPDSLGGGARKGGRAGMDVGIGLRQPHYRHFAPGRRPVAEVGALGRPDEGLDFIEVHTENFFAEGGAGLAVLQGVRERLDVSLHGVGLALGSAAGLDEWHLERLARLVQRIEPVRVSDHACFARVAPAGGGVALHGADLLPIAFTEASLDILCANVQRVQDRLRRPLLVENLSAYLSFADDHWPEADFLAELARRTGCGLLVDLNNLVVNALNRIRGDSRVGRGPAAATAGEAKGMELEAGAAAAAIAFVDALPAPAVGEIHLAGYCDRGGLVIDDHGSRVHAPVWTVYRHALRRLGTVPTLIEWDTDLPPLEVLLDEAAQAAQLQREAAGLLPCEPVSRPVLSNAAPPSDKAAADPPTPSMAALGPCSSRQAH
jgi:uncharacterized protein (UPF0276 family)